jgi:outer membrane murein-binding lipoprotein Lpp
MSFCATRTVAQSIDSLQVVVDSLSIKVVKLEHDLAYLKVDTDIRTLDAKIEILTMRTENILTDFQLAILTNNKSEAKVLYRNLYQSYEERIELAKKELDSLQERVISNKDSFSSFENMNLTIKLLSILSSYNNLEKQMSLIDEALER